MRFRDLIATVNQAGIWTVHLYGHVAAIGRHREKLDRRTGLSRQIRAQGPDHRWINENLQGL
jgi:hypothetical protein